MSNVYNTIVVGLGAAGVTAGVTLAAAGFRVLGLEALDRVGGRVHTVPFGDGVVELGAEWIHGNNPSRVFDAAVENNITLETQDLPLAVFYSNGTKPDDQTQELFNDLANRVFCFADEVSPKKEPLGKFCKRKLVEYLKEEDPRVLCCSKDLVSDVLEYTSQLINNYNASNDWDDVNAQGTFEEVDGHQHMSWGRHGYKTLFDILLNHGQGVPNLETKLNAEVTRIEWPESANGKILVRCNDGSDYQADHVIVTVSVGVLKERHANLFLPKLPNYKIEAIETMAMGVMDKVELSFDEVWWPTDNAVFFGFIWKEEDRARLKEKDLWMTKVFAASRTMGASNVLTLWTSGEVAKQVETMPIDEVKTKCHQLLQRFMGDAANITVPEPTGIERSTWYTNPLTRGSYTYDSMAAAHDPAIREKLAKPVADLSGTLRLLFAGEATDRIHFSTVHGACDTGVREAMRLIDRASKVKL